MINRLPIIPFKFWKWSCHQKPHCIGLFLKSRIPLKSFNWQYLIRFIKHLLYLQQIVNELCSTEDLITITPMILFSLMITDSSVALVIKNAEAVQWTLLVSSFLCLFHCDPFKFMSGQLAAHKRNENHLSWKQQWDAWTHSILTFVLLWLTPSVWMELCTFQWHRQQTNTKLIADAGCVKTITVQRARDFYTYCWVPTALELGKSATNKLKICLCNCACCMCCCVVFLCDSLLAIKHPPPTGRIYFAKLKLDSTQLNIEDSVFSQLWGNCGLSLMSLRKTARVKDGS